MYELRLRPYQEQCLDAINQELESVQRTAVVLPTGTGKTVVMSAYASWKATSGDRVLILVHRDELVRQTIEKLLAVDPEIRVGVVKAGENDIYAQVIVASVQTLANEKRLRQVTGIDHVIVDECHHATASTYKKILDHFGCFSVPPTGWTGKGYAKAVGFTATLSRGDSQNLGDVWQSIAFSKPIEEFIRRGDLVDVRGLTVTVPDLDLDDVKRSGGDFQAGDLSMKLSESKALETVTKAYKDHAIDRQGVLFAPSVDSAYEFSNALTLAGISTEVISGETPTDIRQEIYAKYRTGEIQVLSTCMVLTEGWDAPWASCAVIARPTSHQGLYVQMAGRVLRPWTGKRDAVILDIVGVTTRHSLSTLAALSGSKAVRDQGMVPGESLMQAAKRMTVEIPGYEGDVQFATVDLFRETPAHWLTTPGGNPFIPGTGKLTFLFSESDGTWSVGVCSADTMRGGSWLHKGLELDMAVELASAHAREYDPTVANSNREWRRTMPSPAQVNYATSLGIELKDGMRRGDVADAISVKKAGRVLDRPLAKARQGS